MVACKTDVETPAPLDASTPEGRAAAKAARSAANSLRWHERQAVERAAGAATRAAARAARSAANKQAWSDAKVAAAAVKLEDTRKRTAEAQEKYEEFKRARGLR